MTGIRKIHFVGIGGAGMSAIAKILTEEGYQVSGSDLNESGIISKLRELGAEIYMGQKKANIIGKDAIVVSTAIRQDNPEMVAAKEMGIKIFHRSDIVAYLLNRVDGIAVAGAHGKTTTTSMLGVVLEHAGIDPTIIIGGEVDYLKSNAKLGRGKYLVAEADESDGSFLKLLPKIAVVTNIENDHMDHYGSMDNIRKAFRQFLNNLPQENGLAVLCYESDNIRQVAAGLERNIISYAIEQPAEYQAKDIVTEGAGTTYTVCHKGTELGQIALKVPGRHNVLNSLGAVVVGLSIGLTIEEMNAGFAHFNGAKRRFQTKGKEQGVWIVDDYAHHPTEISTTLAAARQTKPQRLICAFQPHRYSRTQLLQQDFAKCFDSADVLVLTDIYSAGEDPIPGISGKTIVEAVEKHNGKKPVYIENRADIAEYLKGIVKEGDLIMTMGAGDIYRTGEELTELLKN